jgi:sporulation protein YlmC with PRC-barrel domain
MQGAIGKLSLDDLDGAKVIGADGEKIGSVSDVYYDVEGDEPLWALVSTGLFGTRSSFVPLVAAEFRHGELLVPFTKDRVEGAPNIDDEGDLNRNEEAELARHYGMAWADVADGGDLHGAPGQEGVAGVAGGDGGMATSDVDMSGAPQSLDRSEVDEGGFRPPSQLARLRRRLTSD